MTAAVILTEPSKSNPLSYGDKSAVVRIIIELTPYFKEIIVITEQPRAYLPYVKDSARILTPFYKGLKPLSFIYAALSLAISEEIWILHESFPFPGIHTFKEIKRLKDSKGSQCAVYDTNHKDLLYSILDKRVVSVLYEVMTTGNQIADFYNHINWTALSLQKKKSLQT
ncbi:hypothetical protein [Fictibacillus phosphorivorans]|uniref:hypothetical protein n=1 Tax=Fictibacillus phosphorivorans TaxID=1221500 RepID=UPI0020414F0F|nr:hypothetical protein [Fictibacillus phosphorivorans]MCM3717893.1 hypothetical protein [Fictibacillus phosphorivorans]MCM3775342.1 hypothetical protein [Fictibacillus phosphorivorans]